MPVDKDDKLIYCYNKSNSSDVLGPLLEKAYAKLFNCYEYLNGGESIDAMIDLTGSIYHDSFMINELRSLPDDDLKMLEKARLWQLALSFKKHQNKALASVSIKNSIDKIRKNELEHFGLFAGHTYSVLDVMEIFSVDAKIQKFNQIRTSFDDNQEERLDSIRLLKYLFYYFNEFNEKNLYFCTY